MKKLLSATIIASFLMFPMTVSAQSLSEQLNSIRQAAMQISAQIDSQSAQTNQETTNDPNQCSDLRAENKRLRERIDELEKENEELREENTDDQADSQDKGEQTLERIEEIVNSKFEKEFVDNRRWEERMKDISQSEWRELRSLLSQYERNHPNFLFDGLKQYDDYGLMEEPEDDLDDLKSYLEDWDNIR